MLDAKYYEMVFRYAHITQKAANFVSELVEERLCQDVNEPLNW
jgi:hypothetical protein